MSLKFPDGFTFGYATSSYQIEGAVHDDGRTDSVWDTFCREPGRIADGSSGDTACDHYRLWPSDLDLLKSLGAGAYLFSTAWPRVMAGSKPNPAGLDFYSRLVDGLLERGITPFIKLYHWDLPQALQDKGGWINRDTASRFADYAAVTVRRLGDRVKRWVSHNEPWCVSMLGSQIGNFPPGHRDLKEALLVGHHLLLSHGMAADPIRAMGGAGTLYGYAPNYVPAYPATDRDEDIQAARRFEGYFNNWFIDPVFGLGYPEEMVRYYGSLVPEIKPGDMEAIAVVPDFLGINYYNSSVIHHRSGDWKPEIEDVPMPGVWKTADRDVWAPGLYDTLKAVNDRWKPKELFVTENGAATLDPEPENGTVADPDRVRYFREHLPEVLRAVNAGIPVKGYFAWSLMDNFEWDKGYTLRYGVTHVDFKTQKRTVKQSGHWLSELYRTKTLP
jgi:beta-glucosidase